MLSKVSRRRRRNRKHRSTLSVRHSFTGLNVIDNVINNNPILVQTNNFNQLVEFRSHMKSKTLNDVDINQFLTGSNENLVTAEQMKASFRFLERFVDNYPEYEAFFSVEMEKVLYRGSPLQNWLTIDTRHDEQYKCHNSTKKAIKLLSKALFKIVPTKTDLGVLTDYGEQVKAIMGEASFLKATQLLTNQLANFTGFNPTTDAHLKKPLGAYASTWKCPSKAYFIEMQADKTKIPSNSQVNCINDQLQLLEIAKRDGVFRTISESDFENGIKRYVKRQDEVLIPPSHLEESSSVFYRAQTRRHSSTNSSQLTL
ncbi:hypothetical protein L3V82_12060 [Thiotrichales bacterium 19S3-7]|nr:hypothetical protein [Thiotrichales bacterium 19S3-7]MCF6802928.1 hypothetical protein [Thiotrichales bacterium 19S3-11]